MSDTHTQVFQEIPGVLHTLHLVPPLQDCCTFCLVPVCTMEESHDRHLTSTLHITIWHPWVGINWSCTAQNVNLTHLSCDPSLQVLLVESEQWANTLSWIPVGLLVAVDTDMWLTWHVSCWQPQSKDTLGHHHLWASVLYIWERVRTIHVCCHIQIWFFQT